MSYNNRRSYDQQTNNEIQNIISEINKIGMLKDLNVKKYADEGGYADIVAKNSRQLKTNQLRKFFGAIRVIEQKETWDEIEHGFYLLKPRMAVSVGRKNIPKDFYKLIMSCMSKVDIGENEDKVKNFKVFVEFFEAIVAYHKFYYN